MENTKATDIAFALGILSLLDNKCICFSKSFPTGLAIVDDLGVILVISVFYSENISIYYLILSVVVFSVLLLCNRFGVKAR